MLSERLRAAETAMLSRYPDRDEFEIERSIRTFKGMTPEQLRKHFEQQARERGINLRTSSGKAKKPENV
ncbi:hypothetical protein D6L40_06325 [Vibrio alginolyticus]|uniref:hypothetical protein n=1 Tax=Vibrio sp. 506 TaxID=3074607 RepID=UPI001D2D2F4E|nr:hypothetical protein [Vibrio sp. 506]EGQ8471139.1 hypothetical protein [Vibrio alginolyticus]EGR1571106.1 hypothetical protein [Vibrio alginolyticus]MDW2054866.1 hypothetical protein [Vibrio sp. 506]